MTIISVGNLTKYYGAELIFREVSFQIARGDKVAIVGVNGAGKSTLLKMIAGRETPDRGTIAPARGLRLAYLAQEVRFSGERTLWGEMEAALGALAELQAQIAALEPLIADHESPDWEANLERYGELSAKFEHAGGYEIEPRIKRTLQGLGFAEEQFYQKLINFSGGQKTRAALAATLLSDPDVLLLDEPTNHLDMQALEWLEHFLRSWQGTLIVVSHDRYFLDRVTTRTLELAHHQLEDYPGGYNKFLELKAERLERRLKEFKAQQEQIAKTEEFIRRYKAGQRAREAKGREKRLDRYKRDHLLEKPKEQGKLRLQIDSRLRSGDLVLSLEGLVVGYPADKRHGNQPTVLLRGDGLEMHRGERIALLGPNGCGKTTLLRTLIGQHAALQGHGRLGHSVEMSYYAQGHDVLVWQNTVLQELLRVAPKLGEGSARNLLGRFLFSGDDVFKQVSALSGGERSRVALAQLTLLPGNLLLLDEPTNHLDIDAREALEAVLKEYEGAILFVSHDRYFIDALADRLWIVDQGRVHQFVGNYSDYAAAQQNAAQIAADNAAEAAKTAAAAAKSSATPAAAAAAPVGRSNEDRKRQRQVAALEAEVSGLEKDLVRLRGEIEQASAGRQVERLAELGRQYAELERLMAQKYAQWEQLVG
jgi:ATP-binding cassette, subfamily F, member 3